jgi:hypothetical protein
VTAPPPAAWYADPGGSGGLRYWDGSRWTEHLTPSQGAPVASWAPAAAPAGSIVPAAQTPPGRRIWPLVATIAVLFVAAVIAGFVLAVPRIVKAGGRVTDEAAQTSARSGVAAGEQVYALDGSYLGATPERLESLEAGLSFTNGTSTDFTTVSVSAGETTFTVAVVSLTGRCYVASIGDEVGGPVRKGRLREDQPCWASFAADQELVPVDDF